MSEMVEKVARAIFEAWAKEEGSDATWSEVCEMVGQDGYLNAKKWHRMAIAEARAAIEAMRVMNDAMYFAACDEMDEWTDPADGECVKAVFSAAIDAALSEEGR